MGADGVGDPYYPKAGNSGYDVQRYDLVMDVRIAGPDRLRFLGMISRYTALVSDMSLAEAAS